MLVKQNIGILRYNNIDALIITFHALVAVLRRAPIVIIHVLILIGSGHLCWLGRSFCFLFLLSFLPRVRNLQKLERGRIIFLFIVWENEDVF